MCQIFLDFSEYLPFEVGSSQVTMLGPLLWLIYVHDLEVDGFYSVKYADDTTFYAASIDHYQNSWIAITKFYDFKYQQDSSSQQLPFI